ncbi:actin-interacting protein 1 [Lingula anatina]|uniref:Actin-interacting protein 1 n=1 Tax=Lingula anatina TaxID=7574 RepID=A0A1S3II60_LINAN|nr:actin-interacting protein 1 [Lingula anatina]|eukprot:XP_013397813.1 actin-interacting protein 1 [Lingula anatina]
MPATLRKTYACLPPTVQGMPIVIGGDPKGKNFLYTSGNNVIIRNLEDPSDSDIYSQHSYPTNVAQYSPSGFYIASGDNSGKVRIWDTVNKEHILKSEFQPISGAIKDIAWTSDSQKIAAVGAGRDKFGHVFTYDSGNTAGVIEFHSKVINSVDISKTRPFRLATGCEDKTIGFYHGVPFKFNKTNQSHTSFVQAVRFSPDGTKCVSAGSDKMVLILDGKTGEELGQLGNPAHNGGVYAVSWSGDSKKLLTVSGDKTAKIWNMETLTMETEFVFGKDKEHMQVGCLWQGDTLITVSLTGFINYLDPANPSTPKRIVMGHNKPITAMTLNLERDTIYTASSEGRICYWDAATGENGLMKGKGHSSQVQHMLIVGDSLITCGVDDVIKFSSTTANEYGQDIKVDSQPQMISAVDRNLTIVACTNEIVVLRDGRIVYIEKVNYEPTSVSLHPGKSLVAVGAKDHKVHIFELSGDTLREERTLEHREMVTDVKFSPDGAWLAACDGIRLVRLYELPTYEEKSKDNWCFHTAKVTCLAWSPDSRHIASGSLDTGIGIWSVENVRKTLLIKQAHPMNKVNAVAWLDDNTLASVGQGSNLRIWDIVHEG